MLILAIWSATIPLIPYALLRKKYDLLPALVLLFLMLLIDVFLMLNRPNPDRILWIRVTES